jgi:hypothetical protein
MVEATYFEPNTTNTTNTKNELQQQTKVDIGVIVNLDKEEKKLKKLKQTQETTNSKMTRSISTSTSSIVNMDKGREESVVTTILKAKPIINQQPLNNYQKPSISNNSDIFSPYTAQTKFLNAKRQSRVEELQEEMERRQKSKKIFSFCKGMSRGQVLTIFLVLIFVFFIFWFIVMSELEHISEEEGEFVQRKDSNTDSKNVINLNSTLPSSSSGAPAQFDLLSSKIVLFFITFTIVCGIVAFVFLGAILHHLHRPPLDDFESYENIEITSSNSTGTVQIRKKKKESILKSIFSNTRQNKDQLYYLRQDARINRQAEKDTMNYENYQNSRHYSNTNSNCHIINDQRNSTTAVDNITNHDKRFDNKYLKETEIN